ncbi:MAG: type II toxin-antitoxin system HicA family toxin [Candidatus Eremiobacteraeota bacterium]|nr:type II toxin-antitoxin system HicA family toxin [Candidatus Eremiobacteraeota bacterium]
MSRLPRISGEDTKNALLRGGFRLSHVRGSHHYFLHPAGGSIVCIPVHGSRILPLKTLLSIIRQAKLTVEEFITLL